MAQSLEQALFQPLFRAHAPHVVDHEGHCDPAQHVLLRRMSSASTCSAMCQPSGAMRRTSVSMTATSGTPPGCSTKLKRMPRIPPPANPCPVRRRDA
ncbi:MAG: hypothetical protein ACJ8HJ_20610 [Massilia sp.]